MPGIIHEDEHEAAPSPEPVSAPKKAPIWRRIQPRYRWAIIAVGAVLLIWLIAKA